MNQFQYTMLAAIENEKIYQVDQFGRKEIGVISKHYNDTMELLKKFQEKSEQYKKMLEDAGLIKKEKTVQEIQEEQTAMIKALSEQIAKLQAEVRHEQYSVKSDKTDAEQ
jgi:predicted patatin/cPLA2 family phospholipase